MYVLTIILSFIALTLIVLYLKYNVMYVSVGFSPHTYRLFSN
jgi:hypothetical protein